MCITNVVCMFFCVNVVHVVHIVLCTCGICCVEYILYCAMCIMYVLCCDICIHYVLSCVHVKVLWYIVCRYICCIMRWNKKAWDCLDSLVADIEGRDDIVLGHPCCWY